jgi:hypothetical protein
VHIYNMHNLWLFILILFSCSFYFSG